MNIIFIIILIGIASTVVFKTIQLIYLLFKLGFNFKVIKYLIVTGVVASITASMVISSAYSTSSIVIASHIGAMMLYFLFDATKKKPKPHVGKKKKDMISADSDHTWGHYSIGNSNNDCADGGFSSDSGGDGGGCD